MSILIDITKGLRGKDISKVNEVVRQARLDKCKGCKLKEGLQKVDGKKSKEGEDGLMKTGNCKLCGCFVSDKTKYADEKCPIGKW